MSTQEREDKGSVATVERRTRVRRSGRKHGRRRQDRVLLDEARLARVHDAREVRTGQVLDHLTHAAVSAVEAPVAAVSFVDSDRQVFKSVVGLDEPWATRREIPLEYSFCRHAVVSGQPLVVADAREHPLVRFNPSVRELGVIAYAGVPLVTHDGLVLGTFNAVMHEPREWTDDDLEVLRELARAAMEEIEARLAADEAARHAASVERKLEDMLRQHEASFAATTHDLRNYLNVICMGTELLLEMEERGEGGVRRNGERIAHAAGQMNRMLQDLLDSVRDGRDGPAIEPVPTCPGSLLDQVSEQFTPLARSRGIRLVTEKEARLPTVLADVDAIGRVLSNLVCNAVKFTPEGGTVTLAVARDAQPGGVRFTVQDTGPGIPAEQQAHVFDRFWQASRQKGGLGLGLSIARALVEAHAGTIGVESRPGEGACFGFTLPVAPRRPVREGRGRRRMRGTAKHAGRERGEGTNVKTAVLKVEGMSCDHCVRAVTEALESVDGVRSAQVDLAGSRAVVEYDEGRTRPAALVGAIMDGGYTAEEGA